MSFAEEWEQYDSNCLANSSPRVRQIAREAFYCGALVHASMTAQLCKTTSEQSFPEHMQALDQEVIGECERIAKEAHP